MKLSNGHHQLIISSHTHVQEFPQERGSAKSSAEEDMYYVFNIVGPTMTFESPIKEKYFD